MVLLLRRFLMLLLALPVVVMMGCSSDQSKDSLTSDGTTTTTTAKGVGANGSLAGATLANGHEYNPEDKMGGGFDNPASPLSKRVFYFDYDQSEVRADDQATIVAHAQYLANHKDVSVTLEGHTDERGSREYNLALGERRAQAVRRVMQLNGAAPNQIEVVSYGAERPAAVGHEESIWALNRRVEIIYRR